jgi:hypothetical protein
MASLNQNLDEKDFWLKYFPLKIEETPITTYLVNRTLKRPRDIIQFCNLCRDNAALNENVTISENDVLKAEDIYSNWKLNDLMVEWKINYPFLNDLFIIFSNSSYIIYRCRFSKLFAQIKPALETRYKEFNTFFTEDSVLNILYSVGFLGIERNGKKSYYYEDPQTVEFKDNVFLVHPAFRNALKSTSSINVKPFSKNQGEEIYLAEVFRQRSASRQLIESTRASIPSAEHIYSRVESLQYALNNENIPNDIRTEIEENLKRFINEIQQVNLPVEIISFRMIILSFHRYIDNLYTSLKESEILPIKSPMDYELVKTRNTLLELLSTNQLKYSY